jgi:hypothetical protein
LFGIFQKKMVNRFEIEELREQNKSCCNWKRTIVILFIVLVLLGALGALIYFFGVPFIEKLFPKYDEPNVSPSQIRERYSRVDCLPWLRNKEKNVEGECKKKESYCTYQNIDNNRRTPSCYFNKDRIDRKVNIDYASPIVTNLGVSYQLTYYGEVAKAGVQLKLDFEFLDDNVLRFKVNITISKLIERYYIYLVI